MSQPTPGNTPAPGGKKKKAEKTVADYKTLVKNMQDACNAVIKATDGFSLSDKDAEGRDTLPPTDLLGKTIYNDVSVYKSAYKADMTLYTGSKLRTTLADAIRSEFVEMRSNAIKISKAAKKALDDLTEAQSTLEAQRKTYFAANKPKMAKKLEDAKIRAAAMAAQAKKLEESLAQA
jgi:SMC interacting uncharacterized protein involved in chromosome segregation